MQILKSSILLFFNLIQILLKEKWHNNWKGPFRRFLSKKHFFISFSSRWLHQKTIFSWKSYQNLFGGFKWIFIESFFQKRMFNLLYLFKGGLKEIFSFWISWVWGLEKNQRSFFYIGIFMSKSQTQKYEANKHKSWGYKTDNIWPLRMFSSIHSPKYIKNEVVSMVLARIFSFKIKPSWCPLVKVRANAPVSDKKRLCLVKNCHQLQTKSTFSEYC